jgi:hypothetical protein
MVYVESGYKTVFIANVGLYAWLTASCNQVCTVDVSFIIVLARNWLKMEDRATRREAPFVGQCIHLRLSSYVPAC